MQELKWSDIHIQCCFNERISFHVWIPKGPNVFWYEIKSSVRFWRYEETVCRWQGHNCDSVNPQPTASRMDMIIAATWIWIFIGKDKRRKAWFILYSWVLIRGGNGCRSRAEASCQAICQKRESARLKGKKEKKTTQRRTYIIWACWIYSSDQDVFLIE